MIKLVTALLMAFSVKAIAAPATVVESIVAQQQISFMSEAQTLGLDWKVGDNANYSIDMGFLKGTMTMSVRSIGADGIWMDQNMDLGFAGKQKVETLIDPNTGQIKKMLVNGQEQQIPEQDVEVVSMEEGKVTVPAGTFDCIHAIMKDKKSGNEINVWLNPQIVPMSGMLKQIQPSQFGTVTVELKSFKKN